MAGTHGDGWVPRHPEVLESFDMTQLLKRLYSYYTAVVGKAWLGKGAGLRQGSPWLREQVHRPERRREVRTAETRYCELSLLHPISREAAVIEEGQGVTVNQSATGMLLVVGIAPPPGHLLEVQMTRPLLRRSISLVEVCWTKPIREDSEGHLYLVGCRRTFDPSNQPSGPLAKES